MKQSPSGFAWSIEELAHMKPAKIEESAIQQVCSPDPETEMRAQAAIDRFFKETHIPSPWDIREKMEGFPLNDLNSTQELSKSTKDGKTNEVHISESISSSLYFQHGVRQYYLYP